MKLLPPFLLSNRNTVPDPSSHQAPTLRSLQQPPAVQHLHFKAQYLQSASAPSPQPTRFSLSWLRRVTPLGKHRPVLSLGASLPQDYGGLLSPGLFPDSSFPKQAFERQEEGEESQGSLIGSPPSFIFLIIINPGLKTQHSREERRQGTESQEQLLQWARLPYLLLLFLRCLSTVTPALLTLLPHCDMHG